MADSWSVPISTSSIDNLNETIAKGPDLSWINNLADNYFKGKDQRYAQNQRDVFAQGLPKDQQGNIDWSQVSQRLAQVGGAGQVQNIIGLQNQEIARDAITKPWPSIDGSPPQTAVAPPSSATAVPNRPAVANANPSAQPSSPSDIPTGQPAAPGQNITGPNTAVIGVDYGPVQTRPQPVQMAQAQPQVPGASPQSQPALNAPSATDFSPDMANRLDTVAQALRQRSQGLALVNPKAAEALGKQAEAYDARAKQIREVIGKNAEMTPEQKNLSSGATQRAKELEGDIARSQKTYSGIQAQATQYERDLKPYIDLSKSILDQPNMYSGIGGNLVLDFNKVKAALGDKNAAVLQEGLQKITASSVLGQINTQRDQLQEAGGASSRIFSAQVDLVQKAAPSITNTVNGNRFLANVQSRLGDLSSAIAQQARDYIQQPGKGHLDTGFDQQMATYMKNNPVFTKQELDHPQVLGAPTMPAFNNPQQATQWARSMGLKPGDPVKTQSGRYVSAP